MKIEFHPASGRGHANHGWLDTYHSFSFATYFNPVRERFGCLRVLNDDTVDGGAGFDLHPHNNMEIISLIQSGTLEHRDSMGNVQLLSRGEVQVMTAGTGIYHSEYNHSDSEKVKFFQIWIFPRLKQLKPRYDQRSFLDINPPGKLVTLVTPENRLEEGALWIHQDSYISKALLTRDSAIDYQIRISGNGVFVMVVDGKAQIAGTELSKRDAIALSETSNVKVEALENTTLLFIEVPMV